ncbi:MAG: PQQ-like beta-propeller repeat protein [Prevotella sp.]|nr:PQQ-like beta-propeller repeat protein [Prevotella sp.]
MNRNVYRNVALVTVVFALALLVMMGVSWLQMRQTTPLQTEVMETLKQLNESNTENAELADEIRQLDLLSRKAYFTQESHLKTGAWILCGMAAVIGLSLRMYFKDSKNLPEKELDPIDEWMTKSNARKYIGWGIGGLAAASVLFALFTSDTVRGWMNKTGEAPLLATTDSVDVPDSASTAPAVAEAAASDTVKTDSTLVAEAEEPADSFPTPKLTSNAFRGNNSSGRSSARGIPTSWNLKSGKNILWQKTVPKHGYNSPVINGRNIFLTGADGQARELYCFDLWTGELRWTVKADGISGSPSTMPQVNDDTGLAASTVATNGKQVCAIFATGDVICADMDGKRLWAKNLGVPDNHYGFASSLLMYGNELIIQYDNNSNAKLIALSTANGNQLWSKSRKDKIAWSSPIIAKAGGQQAVIVMGNPAITAYSASNGAELWRVECMSGEVGSSPCASNGVIYGASEYATCVAINAETGEKIWEASDCLPECSSPVATKDLLYVATSYGAVCAYNTEDGSVVKQHELTTPFYSSPIIVDGKIYLFSNSGKCYIFSTGKDFKLITSFETGEKTFATPAFTDGMMVVRTDKSLYVVKKES